MLRDDLTYEQIKSCVNNLAQKVAKVPVPMEISPFNNEDPATEAREPVDSFGKGPAGGMKPGKGSGQEGAKGGKGDKKGKETRTCHNCGKKGHLAKDCWQEKSGNKGKGKGSKGAGKRERGSDGRWYRRTGPGINSWELDEDQEDEDEPQEESGERSAGSFTAVGLGSGLEDEEDGFSSLNMLDSEPDWGAVVTDEQQKAITEFASAYARRAAQNYLPPSPTKRAFDIAADDDADDDDDDDLYVMVMMVMMVHRYISDFYTETHNIDHSDFACRNV